MIYTNVNSWGNRLFLRGRDGQSEVRRIIKSDGYCPRIWVPDEDGTFKDVRGERSLREVRFDTIESYRNYRKQSSEVANRQLFGIEGVEYQYIQESYSRTMPWRFEDIRTSTIDIEVFSPDGFPDPQEARYPVNAITVHDSHTDRYYTFSTARWNSFDSELLEDLRNRVIFQLCSDEKELLMEFLKWWKQNYPDIVTGWNSDGFDCVYLYKRLVRLFSEDMANELSPWGRIRVKEFHNRYGKKQTEIHFIGISHLDYQQLHIKHTFKMQESYKLDHIAHVELGDQKLKYDEAMGLHGLYKTDPQKFVDYNIKDVNIVVRLNLKLHLLELVIGMAYIAGTNFEDTFSPVKVWDCLINDFLLDKRKQVPPSGRNIDFSGNGSSFSSILEGAYVKEPQPGLKGWTIVFDYTSLYPSIIQQWNLGVDTIVNEPQGLMADSAGRLVEEFVERPESLEQLREQLEAEDCCAAMNGTFYKNQPTSFLAELMTILLSERKKSKRLMLDAQKRLATGEKDSSLQAIVDQHSTREQALKVLANSGFGATGNGYFRFYDHRIAEAITLSGQMASQWISRDINEFLNRMFSTGKKDWVRYIDTDSVHLDVELIVQKSGFKEENQILDFLSKFAAKLEEVVVRPSNERLQRLTNCRTNRLDLKREAIASSCFWKAKKLYAMRVLDKEGVRKESLKIMGLEAVKSTTPSFFRPKLKECYECILKHGDNKLLLVLIEQIRNEFRDAAPETIAKGSSVSDIVSYSGQDGLPTKGAPQHVKAALVYNHLVKKNAAPLEPIKNGDKTKIVMLKRGNPARSDVIAFPTYFPRSILDPVWIDRDQMFENGFLSGLRNLTNTMGMSVENLNDISAFFG